MTYEEFEDAVLALLKPLKNELGLRALTTYGGEFSPDSFGVVAVNFPAVYLYLSQLESDGRNRLDERRITLTVFAASRNLRGEENARRGSSGVYGLLEAVRAKINRVAVGGGVLRLQREAVTGYSAATGICVAQADYRLGYLDRVRSVK